MKNGYLYEAHKDGKNVEELREELSNTFKATPHKDCASDAQSDFSSDCIKITQAG